MQSVSREVCRHPSLANDHKVLTFATRLLLVLENRWKQVRDYPMTIGPTHGCPTMLSRVRKGARKCTEAQVCPREGWAAHDPHLPQVSFAGYVTVEHKLEPLSEAVKSSEKARQMGEGRAEASCPLPRAALNDTFTSLEASMPPSPDLLGLTGFGSRWLSSG